MEGEKEANKKRAFCLVLENYTSVSNTVIRIKPINYKMPRTEIILLVEAWLERFKQDFSDAVQSSIGSIEDR